MSDLRFLADESLPTLAFLGLGRMGSRLAGSLVRQGFDVTVWNRTPGRTDTLASAGATVETTAARAARHADVVLVMLSGADAVREVLLSGPDPVVDQLRPDATVVDLTTTGPRGARAIAAELDARGIRFVEAPVVGSVRSAGDGTLTTLVGGDPDLLESLLPVLESWTAPGRLVHMGPVGTANAMRSVSVVALGVAVEGIGEALRLGQDQGLDRARLIEALRGGVFGGLVGAKEGQLLSRDAAGGDYPLDQFIAEMTLALYEAASALPAAEAAFLKARLAASEGRGGHDVVEVALRRESTTAGTDAQPAGSGTGTTSGGPGGPGASGAAAGA